MANVSVYNIEGKEVGTIDLSDAIFGVEVNEHLLHMAVVNQLANKRQGTQKAKTRAEVSGGGRKPWRQKGTGHAEAKTKNFAAMLKNLDVKKALVVLEDGNVNAERSARNIADVKTARTNTINVYDIMKYNTVIATKAAVANIEEVYA